MSLSVQHNDSFWTLVIQWTRLSLTTRTRGRECNQQDVEEKESQSHDHQVKAQSEMRAVLGGPSVPNLLIGQDVLSQLDSELNDP